MVFKEKLFRHLSLVYKQHVELVQKLGFGVFGKEQSHIRVG